MPTADKLITVAENVPKVYHAGQLNVIENTSTLKKSASGSAILIDDVSPVTHEMGVKISPVPQKNLLNRLIAKAYSSAASVPTEDFINTYCSKKILFKQGTTYTFSIKSISGFLDDVAWAPRFYIFDNGSLFVSNATSPPVVFSTDFFTSDSSENEYTCYNGSALWSKANMIGNQGPWSMTITPVKDFEAVFIVTDGAVTDNVIITEAQIEVGSTATSYAPYIENPITDLTAVKVKKQGKNLFDKNNVNKLAAYINGSTITSGGQMSTVWVPCSPLTTYTVSKIKSSRFSVCFASEVPTIGGTVNNRITNNASTQITHTSSNTDKYIVIWLYHSGYDTDITESEILDSLQIELGSTATEYEPYITPTEYTPTADGTVNGVTSLYPSTILMTDTEGVLIDCEYYKDIDVNDVIERTVTAYTNPKIKIIGDYAFYGCSALTYADIPVATNIGDYAFSDCTSLTSVNFPITTSIGNGAFYGCSALTSVDFPIAISIGNNAFSDCTSLTSADFPIATSIGNSAFSSCSALTTADFLAATSISGYAFSSCSALTTVAFPVATSIGNSAFSSCSALTTVDFPAATSINNNVFRSCTSLTTADFPAATNIYTYAFYGCSALNALILRNSTICTLSNKNAFTDCTKITGTGGYIYVPSSLIDTYKTATNWVTYASKFRALEDYTVDGTTTGALDESKVSA